MGQYDEQLKNWYANQKTDKADYGLYEKKNSDGSFSDTDRVGKVTAQATADYRSGKKTAPKSNLESNAQLILDSAPGFVRYDTKISFGSREYDKEAFERAAAKQKDWWEKTGSTHKKYGYDMSNPEDVKRASEGKYSVAYENSFGDDEYSQWLLKNGQASGGYFESRYYNEAYADIMLERQQKEAVRNFKKAVAQEAWSSASDPMNISGDDIAAAAQRVQIKNPQYAGIAITNTKESSDPDYSDYVSPMLAEQTAAEKDAEKRATSLYLDEVLSLVESYQSRQRRDEQKAVEAAERKNNELQDIINLAIENSGFSVEIDNRVGLAKDSTLDEWNANKELKRKAATDAVGAMEVAGASKDAIKKAIRQDGRLSYIEDSEQGIQDEATRIQRRDASDTVVSDILMKESPIVQASVARAKSLANMGTAAQAGFSPISMMEGYALSDAETAYVEKYMADTRLALEMSGYDGLEIDNAFRRADLGEYIPKETARANYAVYTLNEMGCSNEQTEAILGSWSEEDWAAIDKDMSISDYVEDSTIDIAGKAIISVPIRAALSIISGAVGFADMVEGSITGRTEAWELTDKINEQAAWWASYSHDRNHEMISEAADIGSEMLRMYATSMMGTGLAAASTKLMSTAKGTGFLFNFISKNASRFPFVTGAIGNYYNEAMNEGTTARQAAAYAIPAGLLEGYLESLEMGQVMKNTFGVNFVGKKIAASGLSANFKQFAITKGMPFINFALDVLGEGIEESLSAIGSSMLRTATWDEYHELEMSDVWQNAKGGLILGAVMGGLSMPSHTQSYKYASKMYADTQNYSAYIDSLQSAMYMENMNDVQRQALIDKYNSGEINVSRDAAINAGVEIQTNAEVVAAKKQAVESAENDAAVKVENANNKVTQAEQRLAGIDDPDPVKKGKKLAQAARELTSAKAAASQVASEGQKKVDTATADYKSEAAKVKRKNAANQQMVDEYHASKYCSDIEAETDIAVEAAITAEDIASLESLLQSEKDKLAAMPYQNSKAAIRRKGRIAKLENQIASGKAALNAAVSPAAVEPTTNTTASINTAENRIDTVKNGVAQTVDEEYNDIRGDINGKADGTAETEAGGNAGVSGQTVTVPYSGMAQGLPGMDRRTDYRGIGSPVKDIIRQQGATPVDLRTATDPSSFYAAISDAKRGNPHGAFVTAHDVSEYGNMKMFLSDDNGVGVAVTKDGDIVSVFKNPNISKSRKAVSSILLTAIDNGGVKLDNYNGELSRMYLAHGFIPVARTAFVDEYAPSDWNYERDGRPDIIFWRHNGDNVEAVARNIGTQEMPDLKALPLMEYDEAAAYRDSLIPQIAPEPALKDLGANTPTPVEMKTRKSYSNTFDKAMSAVSNAVSKVSGTYYNEGSYAVSKEKDTLAIAQEAVRGELENAGTLAGLETRLSSREAWTAENVDTAMIMAEVYEQEALETGDFTSLENLKRIIGEHLTEAGQVVQAMAKWSRTTNAGASVWVERTINKLNEKNADKIAKGKASKITVPDDFKAKLAAAKTKADRDSVLAEISAVIGQQIPTDVKSMLDALRYMSMLGNARTHIRNIFGNTVMRGVIQAKNVVGAGIESVAISDQSKRTKAVLSNSESDTALKEYASSTWDFVKHEFDGSKYSDGEKGFAKAVEDNRTIFKWSVLEKLRKLNDAGLALEDSRAAKKLYTRTFAQAMKARGLTAETITEAQKKEIAGIAINEAIKGTFHDANQFAKTLSKWENGSIFGKVFIGGTLPFKNTPINIAKRGVEYSPIGLIKGVFGDLPKVKKGEMSAAQAIDGIASGFVGTSLFAIGAFLAKAGILRGEGEDSDKEEYYRRDLGDQPYAIYIGDKSYTIDWLSPAAMPLFMGVEFQKILSGESDSDNVFDAVLDFASQITNPLLQLSFLEGVNDTLTAAQESEYGMIVGAIANAPGNYLSQFIPTLSGQIARTIDPVRRNTKGDPTAEMGQEVDEYLNKIKAKIPFLSSTLPAYVNAWGDEEVDDSHWAMRLIKNAISPGYSDERNYSGADEEILRLFEATNNESILPNYYYTYRDLTRKGEIHTLTNEEWTEFRKDWGAALYEAAEDAMRSNSYIAMTDDEKADYIAKAMKSARDDIANKYKDKYLGK